MVCFSQKNPFPSQSSYDGGQIRCFLYNPLAVLKRIEKNREEYLFGKYDAAKRDISRESVFPIEIKHLFLITFQVLSDRWRVLSRIQRFSKTYAVA